MSRELRVGSVPYLNARPLVEQFEVDPPAAPVRLELAPPAVLAERLEAGELDVALVSIFEWFRRPDMRLAPGIAIAADGPVRSVRLFCLVEPAAIRSVALDAGSLTAAALTRIILRDAYGVSPTFRRLPPDPVRMLGEADAALLIGDLGQFGDAAPRVLDLGEEWKRLTGLPFVYAAWLAHPQADLGAITALLSASRDWGAARIQPIAARWSARMNVPLPQVLDYYHNIMIYDLDSRGMEAVEAFRSRCHALALLGPSAATR